MSVRLTFADVLDTAYRWFWRLPACGPGGCYCRRTCPWLIDSEDGAA